MALIYATGTKRNDAYTGLTTARGLLDSINTTLVAAGWSSAQTKAFIRVNFTGQPANGNTITLDGKVYTFQTVLTNSDGNVQIGASALISYQNLKNAINLGPGAGTAYAAATTLHSTMEAPAYLHNDSVAVVNPTATDLKIQAKTAGTGGRSLAVSETLANATLSFAATRHDGYKWDSAVTPEGLRVSVWGFDTGEGLETSTKQTVRFHVTDLNNVSRSHTREPNSAEDSSPIGGFRVGVATAGANWRVIANKHCFWILQDGVSAGANSFFGGGTVSLNQTSMTPFTVTGATNATPIVITTSANHGFTTGDSVCLRNIGGNLAANNTFTVTVLTPTTFSLDGSVGSGAYTSGGVCAKIGQDVAEAIYGFANSVNTTVFGRIRLCADGDDDYVSVNGQSHLNTTGIGNLTVFSPISSRTDDAQHPTKYYDGSTIVSEPLIGWGTAAGAQSRIVGQLYDAALIMESMTIDQTGTFDSHNWWNLTDTNVGSTTLAEGSLAIVVP